ncbi:MAG: UvrD-helicase domain-containing protein, partial [Gammaproteobacteria bacterium]
EDALIAGLREAAPDADREDWQILNVRMLCDALRRDTGVELGPDRLSRLLKSFAEAFGSGTGQRGFYALRPAGQDNRLIKLLRPWQDIETLRKKRMKLAQALVNYFITRRQGSNLLVTCRQGDLESALQADLTLQDLDIRDWNVALAAALLYLDANEVLHLARGKAVFRTAMSIRLNNEARRRQFKQSDYAELALHYKDKIIQVHVMAEYARLALGKIQAAMAFIVDYFSMDRGEFVQRYFAGRQEILEMATTEVSHRRILTELQNPEQQAIVAAPTEGNHLVLAGPGSGKTKVIVHRVAWLLRECMVPPEDIMVLSFNRSAAIEIRKRLWSLIGADAAGVAVQTLHGLAMRLTGTSYAVAAEHGESIDFASVIKAAIALLKKAEPADETGASIRRDRLLSGLRYLLVDEYQDINAEHYDLISALAGRSLNSDEDKLSLMAVGDDDQNIYAFGGANVRFIRQFADDYHARTYFLTENYRSTAHIIHCASRVISPARDRMKARQTLRVDHARYDAPDGGEFAAQDSLTHGRVHILETPTHVFSEVELALAELMRLNTLENLGQIGHWGQYAVIARQWESLEPMAALCRKKGIPARLIQDDALLDLHVVREGFTLLSLLKKTRKSHVLLRWGSLSRWFRRRYRKKVDDPIEHPYRAMLAQFIIGCESAAPGCRHVVIDLIEALYEIRSGSQSGASDSPHAPLLLLTAHRAKGLEFDHVLILDAGGWQTAADDERRLYYVAMTRARKTLTLCSRQNHTHPFIRDCENLCLKSRPKPTNETRQLDQRIWMANPTHVVLSWPGYFSSEKPIHKAIATLDYGSPLALRTRSDGKAGWELADPNGVTVSRMAQSFSPPKGEIIEVRVAAILERKRKQGDPEALKCEHWEVILPEILYLIQGAQKKKLIEPSIKKA